MRKAPLVTMEMMMKATLVTMKAKKDDEGTVGDDEVDEVNDDDDLASMNADNMASFSTASS